MTAALSLVPDSGSDEPVMDPLEAYEVWMRARGMSGRWIKDSLTALRHLQRRADRPIAYVTSLDISRFLARNLTQRSRYTLHGELLGFYRWYGKSGGRNLMVDMPRPRLPRTTPRPVTPDQVRRILAVCNRRKTRMMILLAALAGLRVSEVARVKGEDVDLDARTIRVRGKGGVEATVPLHRMIVDYAREAEFPTRGWWFPTNRRRGSASGHVGGQNVSEVIRRTMRRADVHATPHALRHFYGTELVRSGTDLRTAQSLLRHASLATTAIYTAVADEGRAAAIDRLHL